MCTDFGPLPEKTLFLGPVWMGGGGGNSYPISLHDRNESNPPDVWYETPFSNGENRSSPVVSADAYATAAVYLKRACKSVKYRFVEVIT